MRLSISKILMFSAASLVTLGGCLYFFLPQYLGLSVVQQDKIPVIYPSNIVFKLRPKDPGGEKILYLEYEIYDRLTHGSQQYPKLEILASENNKADFKKISSLYKKNNQKLTQHLNLETENTNQQAKLAEVQNAKFYIQLYASQKINAIEKAKKTLLSKHSSFFKSQKFIIKSVSIQGKGNFYRLYIGPFLDWKHAKKLCGDYKQNKIDCFVAQP